MDKEKNIHKGHRESVRQRFIKSGSLDSFADHEILELVLFYAYPMKDTNELAHKFINEYGSLYELMSDTPENLMKRLNINENTAVLISMLPYVNRRYMQGSFGKGKPKIDSFSAASRLFTSLLVNERLERVYLLFLNAQKRLTKISKLNEGMVDGVFISAEGIIKESLSCNAKYAFMGHNHPGGGSEPSENDLAATRMVVDALAGVGIQLLDHIIVCSSDYLSNYSFMINRLIQDKSKTDKSILKLDVQNMLSKYDFKY